MRENSKFIILIAFLYVALLLAVIGMQIPNVVGVSNPGVSVDDWAEYYMEGSGNPPTSNFTGTLMSTVKAVSGTNVTWEGIIDYGNGTVETDMYVVDVDSGQGNGSLWLIAASLNTGDLVYANAGHYSFLYEVTINETIPKDYLGSSAQVNHVNLTRQTESGPPLNYTYSEAYNFYWYQPTGVLAELSWDISLKNQTSIIQWSHIYVVITGIVPEFPQTLIVPLVLIIPLITVLFSKALLTRWRLCTNSDALGQKGSFPTASFKRRYARFAPLCN